MPYKDKEKEKARKRAYWPIYYEKHKEEISSKRMAKYYANAESRVEYARILRRKQAGVPEPTRPSPPVCEICHKQESNIIKSTGLPKSLSADHCHATNKFRGWLCFRCNAVLGQVRDDAWLLRKLSVYLENFENRELRERMKRSLDDVLMPGEIK